MENQFIRSSKLIQPAGLAKLQAAKVIVFGVGGVGGFVVESLVRSGIGAIDLVDHDVVSISNLNRQIVATHQTLNQLKVEAMKNRILSIHPLCKVNTYPVFYLPENADQFDLSQYDYVIDCIDTVSGKLAIIETCYNQHIKVISCMGAGNKMDPTGFMVADINQTSVCPLAKVMRRELKKRGIDHCKVVYSKEMPYTPLVHEEDEVAKGKHTIPGSMIFCVAAAGLLIANCVVKELIE